MNTYATYSPEDNKLRLYVGHVPREEYLKLKAEGWQALHKQREAGGGDFAAVWTPQRRDTALRYSDVILDEDMGPDERAADRAERFGDYRDKRTAEATGEADRYEGGPSAHGYQSAARAERAAARHDRIGDRAVDAWSKAEYWQRRTAGVISHSLYLSSPAVRMGRIKTIEAELRKNEADGKSTTEKNQGIWDIWNSIAGNDKPIILGECVYSLQSAKVEPLGETGKYTPAQCKLGMALMMIGNVHTEYGSERYKLQKATEESLIAGTTTPEEVAKLWLSNHPERPADYVPHGDWNEHYRLRLAYEHQMIEAQGGRAAFVEMVPGGMLGNHLIMKVNKSPATGRVVSVFIKGPKVEGYQYKTRNLPKDISYSLHQIDTERMAADAYKAPTPESLAALKAAQDEAKAKTPKKEACPLINPTDEDAERLQKLWNDRAFEDHKRRFLKSYGRDYAKDFRPSTIYRMTQAQYSEASKGEYGRAKTKAICHDAQTEPLGYGYGAKLPSPKVCQLRTFQCDGSDYGPPRVIILTDKGQKPFPPAVWAPYVVAGEIKDHNCENCEQPFPKDKWEEGTSKLFVKPISCPACQWQQEAPEAWRTPAKVLHGKSGGLSYTVNA